MHSLLPNSGVDHFILDEYCDDIHQNHSLFEVELDTYGELIFVDKTVNFITGNNEDDSEEDENIVTDGSYIYKYRKRSYFAADENAAVSLAKIAYQSNKDFQDHADDGVSKAMDEFERELALGLVRVNRDNFRF
ncbi:hypothetical protein L0657_04680 [Dyadobacter sp. CY345]|uniref:hypothetical protein n=1 Tax=Dyadobacter sp. CY345 TaxID=2909335 RepID=UPI001F442796|nr:hypothetical protein [Dyadobacter sp. CY345]MCF2443242.1 hypothetical protein [Dyadobacter sp. CY345]